MVVSYRARVGTSAWMTGRMRFCALSSTQVEAIRDRFNALNPYDRTAVTQILKHEAEGLCLAISAKRYALYNLDDQDEPNFLVDHPPSEHGLGHYLDPADPSAPRKLWIRELWHRFVLQAQRRDPEPPSWFDRPTMMRATVTAPAVLRAFSGLNQDRNYRDQVKPFNFLTSPTGVKPPATAWSKRSFRLVATWEADPSRWEAMTCIDVHDPGEGPYRITTRDGRPDHARVDTFAEVAARYVTHPESKSAGPDGSPCQRSTIGLLGRRLLEVGAIKLIGKESNRVEERAGGELTIADVELRMTTFEDHDEVVPSGLATTSQAEREGVRGSD